MSEPGAARESSQFRLLAERRFAPLFLTQFFGAFNNNVMKNALGVLVTFQAARFAGDGEMSPFRPGIRQVLDRTPVPVVPMALSGLWKSLFARNRDKIARLFPRIRLAVGEPVDPARAMPERLQGIVLGLRGEWR